MNGYFQAFYFLKGRMKKNQFADINFTETQLFR